MLNFGPPGIPVNIVSATWELVETIIGGTSFVISRNKNILWIKLDKSFFDLDKDLYLGTVYISPNTSQVIDQELLDDIESEIVNFTLKGDVILQGDFNARTDSMQEWAILQIWMEARLTVTLFWYKPSCFIM